MSEQPPSVPAITVTTVTAASKRQAGSILDRDHIGTSLGKIEHMAGIGP